MTEAKIISSDFKRRPKVVIVGAGIAGLACAYYLRKHGVSVKVLERNKMVGGCIRSAMIDNRYLLEYGPNSFLSTATPLLKLARELSVDSQMLTNPSDVSARFILHQGKLQLLPNGPKDFLSTKLLSFSAKMRALYEPWIKTKATTDESLASFVSRRAGQEILDVLVDPFVSGIYAGDPEQLSVQSVFPQLVEYEKLFGSVMKGMKKSKHAGQKVSHKMISFRWGMGTLPARLEEVLRNDICLNTEISSLERLQNGKLSLRQEEPRRSYEAEAVVLSAPASVAANILSGLSKEIVTPLVNIPYAPIAVIHTAFKKQSIKHPLKGFGFLIPRKEKVRLLGSVWSSSLFEGRCPKDEVLLTHFIGGMQDPTAIELDDHELLHHVREGLELALGIESEPTFVKVKRYTSAIPQYTLGHQQRKDAIQEALANVPGVFLTGNYFSGISVSDTIEHARHTAHQVLDHLGVWKPKGGTKDV
ncbi:MAG: protoporphyrinogen oxidase [Deltaproteobacteria bacterium CG_4_10_14_0_2_um_filter_43_8]|nr:MAG: protoporphyrinogen oxidase [Deltaproteobacteria bacterium CG_4_10_14_0_2_um_filter_43_8]PJC64766.1 MAG: protoporphyrinogen oxidase [Deltaproteobacteria bacterium CG_4_9_14_0_2_um_filter_42_21]